MAKDWYWFAFHTREGNALLKELGDRAVLALADESLGGRTRRRAFVQGRVGRVRV